MELIILILALIGVVAIFFAGTLTNDDGVFLFFPLFIGTMFIALDFFIIIECTKEVSIRKYVNNELTYDTVSINKEGKLLEIKVIKK